MSKTKRKKPRFDAPHGFSEFIADPFIASALLVFALIALFLSILEFSRVIAY